MTPYVKKAMKLAVGLTVTARRPGHAAVETLADLEALRQHLETGEPDCRTCVNFVPEKESVADKPYCHFVHELMSHHRACSNFSQYKRADYIPLCEVTK